MVEKRTAEMNTLMEELTAVVLLLCTLLLVPGGAHSESLVTVSGVISDEGQLFGSDGVIYDIDDTETGLELMEMPGQQVKVRGYVTQTDESAMLVVLDFEVRRK